MGKSVNYNIVTIKLYSAYSFVVFVSNEYASPVIVHTNTLAAHADYKPEVNCFNQLILYLIKHVSQLKILKRPQDAKNRKETTLSKPIKSLAEKEKDYETAKRLINEKFEKK